MGLYDRDYTQEGFHASKRYAPQMMFRLPRLTPVVKWLLIANVTVFLANSVLTAPNAPGYTWIELWFSVYPTSLVRSLELWRLITYQFIHWGLMHIVFNMIGLYFLGPVLEAHWGSRKFLFFYLGCGVAGGLFYLLLVAMNFLSVAPMGGASGAILGMLAACAILFPQFVVFFLFFPVPIRLAAIILIFIASATILSKGINAGGEAAHLAGMAAGAIYVFSQSWRTRIKLRLKTSRWRKDVSQERRLHIEVDRILKKVHDHGIHSLSQAEKRILKKATRIEQMHRS